MKFQSLVTLALPATVMGVALPIGWYSRDEFLSKRANTAAIEPTGPEYRLKTQLVNDNDTAKAHFDGLYLTAFHTGAGTNDAVFVADQESAATGFLNETADSTFQEFDFGTEYVFLS